MVALAWMCEVDRKPIYNALKQTKECPKALMGMDLSNALKISNPNGGLVIQAIPAETCYDILYYYSHEARGRVFLRQMWSTLVLRNCVVAWVKLALLCLFTAWLGTN
jgi:hypothetical protein